MALPLNMLTLYVKDLEKEVAFWRDVVKFPCKWDGETPYAEFQSETLRFAMFKRDEFEKLVRVDLSYPEGTNGSLQLSLKCENPVEVDQQFEHLVSNGAKIVHSPKDMDWGFRSAKVTDPEGTIIELFAWLEGFGE